MESIEILLSVITLSLAVYYYLTVTFNFWRSRGVPGPKPFPVVGTVKDVIMSKLSTGCYLKQIYERYRDKPMVGIFTGSNPVLVLNDMELIKTTLIKDFNSFSDRGLEFDEKHELLGPHLFNLESKKWRQVRPKLTPAYTSGKLRDMFHLLRECADQLDDYLENHDGDMIDIREIAAKFTTDVIGVCAFGLQMKALEDPDSLFRQMGKRIFDNTLRNVMRRHLKLLSHRFYKIIAGWLVDRELQHFFIKLTRDTLKYRIENNIVRHDFVEQLKELKEMPREVGDIELTDSFMAAQLFIFFVAGFETSSSTISNCLLELAMNHNVRDQLREEISAELKKTDGVMPYEGIKNMEYLDKVIKETLRKYPPLDKLMRISSMPYTFPNTTVTIPTGTKVWIPVLGIQRDPQYFPNPEAFLPERFTEEAIKARPQATFLPFGDGPRRCIGMRFGTMQIKVGVVKILQKFKVDVCEKTDKEYKINPKCFLLTPLNGVFVKLSKAPIGW